MIWWWRKEREALCPPSEPTHVSLLRETVLTGRRTVVQWLLWRAVAVAGDPRERGLLDASLLLLQYVERQLLARGWRHGRRSHRCVGCGRRVVQHPQLSRFALFLRLLASQRHLQQNGPNFTQLFDQHLLNLLALLLLRLGNVEWLDVAVEWTRKNLEWMLRCHTQGVSRDVRLYGLGG
jgi:hypothetical protein